MVKENKENRRFRRYKKRYTALIIKEKESHSGEMIDYSLDGFGVILKSPLQINKGDVLTIENDELSLRASCQVEWFLKTPSGLRVGLYKLEPLKGSLINYSLSDIFIGIQRSLKTGVLTFRSGSIENRIYIKSGDMIFASSNQNHYRLGDILLRERKITQEAFDRSSELIRKTGKRQGAILVELGAITPKELCSAVKHQVQEIILSVFDLSDGEFEFQETSLPTDEVITLKLSAGNLIYRGVKRPTCVEQVEDFLNLPSKTVIAFSKDPLSLFQDITFDDDDQRIISLIDGKRHLKEIISLSGSDESKVRKSVAALLSTSIIEAAEKETIREGITPEDVISKPEIPQGIIEKIEEMYSKLPNLNYYELLGVEESVNNTMLQWAFYRLAKEFHPDRHFYLDKDMKEKLHEIFTSITHAYSVLSSSEKRRGYDRSIAGKQTAILRVKLAIEKFDEGRTAYERKDFVEAAQSFAEAAHLDDSMADYHFSYGLSLAKLDKMKEAEQVMKKALKLAPQNDEILAELGHIYLKLGFPVRAQWKFKKALEINMSNQRAKEGMESI